jgi:hypothetical protein
MSPASESKVTRDIAVNEYYRTRENDKARETFDTTCRGTTRGLGTGVGEAVVNGDKELPTLKRTHST